MHVAIGDLLKVLLRTHRHLQNLTDLAEALSPQIARFCTGAVTDMTSVFCSPPQSMVSDESDTHSQSAASDIGEWMLSPEELVDQLLCGYDFLAS